VFRVSGFGFRIVALSVLLAHMLTAGSAFGGEPEPRPESDWVAALYREFYAGDLRAALELYERSAEAAPGHRLAPDALLRAALCREKLGDLEGALKLAMRVKLEYPRAAAARSRAEEIQKRLEGPAAWTREKDTLVRENESLHIQITELSVQLGKALASLKEGARDEKDLKTEVEGLKGRIDSLNEEKTRLQARLESHVATRRSEAELSPDEILREAERDHDVREGVKRQMAEHFFRTGLKLQAEEKWQEARDSYERCLDLWDGHPKARDHLLRVGALLGDPESMQEELLRRLEIRKEIRNLEKKQELGKTFRDAFELYRAEDFQGAEELFLEALNLLVRDLPEGPEFDRQKDLAARYIQLCRDEAERGMSEKKGDRSHTVEVRLRVITLPHSMLTSFAREHKLVFARATGGGQPALQAPIAKGQIPEFVRTIGPEGEVVLNETTILVMKTARLVQKFAPGRGKTSPGFTLQITPRLGPSGTVLQVSLNTLHTEKRAFRLPGHREDAELAEFFSQHFAVELALPREGGILLAGPRNPFGEFQREKTGPDREDLVVVIEVVG
jgi:tetratricopeptide (TPR) repeat protein